MSPAPSIAGAPPLTATPPPDGVAIAFAHARAAAPAWAATGTTTRVAVLRRLRHLLAEQGTSLATSVARPPAETLSAQVIPLADALRHLEDIAPGALAPRSSGLGRRPAWLLGVRPVIHREALGVVLVIAPSNYPLFIPGTQVAQALAAGNAVVLKPGAGGRPAALALQQLLVRAGLDPRLFSVLPETSEAARSAVSLAPDHILFTGSSDTGRTILRAAAQSVTRCTLELSGCDPVLVRADADLDHVARALLFGLRLNDGATCIAPRRVFAPASVLSGLEQRLVAGLSGSSPATLPPTQFAILAPRVLEALEGGARLVWPTRFDASHTAGPILISDVPPEASILDADLFAPVLSMVRAETDEEALALAGRSRFALGGSIFTRDLAAARRMAAALPAGVITINDLILPTADPRIPFGGRAASGYGVTRGTEGLLELTRLKVVSTRHGRWAPHLDAPAPGDAEFFAATLRVAHARGWADRLRSLPTLLRLAWRRSRHAATPLPARPAPTPSVSHP